MSRADTLAFVGGLFSMGFAVLGAMFLRFWASTREGLFAAFAVAFGLLAAGQAATALLGTPGENRAIVYLPRLAAFVLILIGIARKNLSRRG